MPLEDENISTLSVEELYKLALYVYNSYKLYGVGEKEDIIQELVLAALKIMEKIDCSKSKLTTFVVLRMNCRLQQIIQFYNAQKRIPISKIEIFSGECFQVNIKIQEQDLLQMVIPMMSEYTKQYILNNLSYSDIAEMNNTTIYFVKKDVDKDLEKIKLFYIENKILDEEGELL